MPRPIHARIHLSALRNNLDVVRRHAPGARVWTVVKANAYGHGLGRAYPGLSTADGFALLDLDEAQRLRELGWSGPILLLEGVFQPADLDTAARLGLSVVVHSEAQLRMLEARGHASGIGLVLKLNTGMNRLGIVPGQAATAWQRLAALGRPGAPGALTLMSHFANADGAPGVADQLACFSAARAAIAVATGVPANAIPITLANSAGILWHAHAHGDWVRPGIMLYGASPTGVAADIAATGLQPAMTLGTELIAVQDVAAGAAVGYGSAWVAARPTRIGIAACGYADGYPRHARGSGTGRTPVLVAGRRCLLAGRVSMDMLAIELPEDLHADVGAPVTLWGAGLPIDEVAATAGTVGYELMCAVAPRVPVSAG